MCKKPPSNIGKIKFGPGYLLPLYPHQVVVDHSDQAPKVDIVRGTELRHMLELATDALKDSIVLRDQAYRDCEEVCHRLADYMSAVRDNIEDLETEILAAQTRLAELRKAAHNKA